MNNLILDSDSYKEGHHLFYEDGIQEMYDYLESRGGLFGDTVSFGMQAHLQRYLVGSVVTRRHVEEAKNFCALHFGRTDVFNYDGWRYITDTLHGVLPIEIYAIPEGNSVPVRTPILAYKNTDPKCSWLAGHLEPLLFKLWYPITIATLSQHIKKMIYSFLVKTGTVGNIQFMLTDFALRGTSSEESAAYGGAAHLVSFVGSDNIPGILFAKEYYPTSDENYMPGFSVRATEHSVMTHRGRALEGAVVKDILAKCPDGIVAMVGDSYDIFNFAEKILGTDLHTEVVEREGIVVVRPDSGDPIPVMMKLLWILGEKFGWTVNSKGYRVLNHVRTLQGDGNNYDAIYNMLRALKGARLSADNIATFGMGGALLQSSTRDTQKMAIKLSSLTDKDGNWRDVFKDPITDPGKGSKYGRFAVVKEHDAVTGEDRIVTKVLKQGEPIPSGNLLRPIFRNGELLVHDSFEVVRARADEWMATA